MNKLIKFLFLIYQSMFKTSVASCRYSPTCSQYLVDATEKYGTLKGLYLTTKRILSCQPFSKRPFYDPV